ncbi:hypothetical protein FKM82_020119 [Ascaphus truei]
MYPSVLPTHFPMSSVGVPMPWLVLTCTSCFHTALGFLHHTHTRPTRAVNLSLSVRRCPYRRSVLITGTCQGCEGMFL